MRAPRTPGTTHFFGLSRTVMVVDAVTTFLDTDPASPIMAD